MHVGARTCLDRVMARNVLGGELEPCSYEPLTGFYRDGCCESGGDDAGVHSVCVVMTERVPRVLTRPGQRPEHADAGARVSRARARRPLVPLRVALAGGVRSGHGAGRVLEATHARTLEWCSLAALQAHAASAVAPAVGRRSPSRMTSDRARPAARVRVEPGPKRVRAYLGGVAVVDSTRRAIGLGAARTIPMYYFPLADVRTDLLRRDRRGPAIAEPRRRAALRRRVGDRVAPAAAYRHADSPLEELRELVAFTWSAMDHWFEEDEEVHVHPRSPYTRVDILPSSRVVRVEIDGVIGRRVGPPDPAVRDRAADPLLLRQARRAARPARADRSVERVPLQGHGALLVGRDRRHRVRRLRVGLRLSAAREHPHRRPDLLLQRAGRPRSSTASARNARRPSSPDDAEMPGVQTEVRHSPHACRQPNPRPRTRPLARRVPRSTAAARAWPPPARSAPPPPSTK